MLCHLVAFFFLVGCLYDRYRNRLINYYSNLLQTMPIFSFFFFIYSLTNFSFPGTCNFIGEILILVGIFEINIFVMVVSALATLFTLIYSIWLFNRIIFGTIKLNYIKYFTDLHIWEFEILFYFSALILLTGLKPNYILEITCMSSINLLSLIHLNI